MKPEKAKFVTRTEREWLDRYAVARTERQREQLERDLRAEEAARRGRPASDPRTGGLR